MDNTRLAPIAARVTGVGLAPQAQGDDTVRKVKLEMQVSLDGFALDVDGKTDWMVWSWGEDWTWDEALRRRHIDLTTSSDCILLSRMMAKEDFVGHWANVDPADPRSAFAQPITKMRKVVFSKTLDQSKWPNTDLAKGELADVVTRLKAEQGKDIIAYGGPNFAGSLLRAGLIDEFHRFVNPVVLGAGRSMFKAVDGALNLTPENATTYECGVVVLQYSIDRDPMFRRQAAGLWSAGARRPRWSRAPLGDGVRMLSGGRGANVSGASASSAQTTSGLARRITKTQSPRLASPISNAFSPLPIARTERQSRSTRF